MDTADFDYELPDQSIAQTAIEPRDASRLLVTDTMQDHTFRDLPSLLRPHDLLIVNRTRVRAARLRARRRDTGGAVELLLLRRYDDERWEALAKPARRLRPGIVLDCDGLSFEVASAGEGVVVITPLDAIQDVETIVAGTGEVPLPPYFRGSLDDAGRYQTVYAERTGSAAAPTAGLHFTERLITELFDRGVELTGIELEVGLDTFRPVMEDRIEDHVIHRERYVVPEEAAAAVKRCRERGGRVVAVGTTVVRTLETAADPNGSLVTGSGESDLFITPGYRWRLVDALLTNFHAPRTTLIVLIAAVLGERWRSVYGEAIERGYRFLSFGDAMFVPAIPR